MYDDAKHRFCLRCGVVIQQKRIIRVRPMFPSNVGDISKSWSIQFVIEYDETVIESEKALVKAMDDAGKYIGLCDFRPKYGRFQSEIL
jgi:hypothetical protein